MIKGANLSRDVNSAVVTLGQLQLFSEEDELALELQTLENPWRDNEINISCIPVGEYVCRRVQSPKYGETFEIVDVEGRTHILFHWGNYLSNTKGCVLLGLARADDVPAVWSSKAAHAEFMKNLEGVDEFPLSIYEEAV